MAAVEHRGPINSTVKVVVELNTKKGPLFVMKYHTLLGSGSELQKARHNF